MVYSKLFLFRQNKLVLKFPTLYKGEYKTMIYLIVGHRGVGKTFLLKKLKKNFKNFYGIKVTQAKYRFLDLDQQIEKKTGQKVADFFSANPSRNKLQKNFRELEKQTLKELIDQYKVLKQKVFIAVGAGFKGSVPSFCHVIHLIRETDSAGRVFLDRPRLRRDKSPYEESKAFYLKRENFYRSIKTESLVLPEGDLEFKEGEKLLLGLTSIPLKSIITLNKNSLPALRDKWLDFIKKRISWGLSFFELRDDELKNEELEFLLKIIPTEKQLLSFRKPGDSFFLSYIDLKTTFPAGPVYDWSLEKGKPLIPPPVLSLHKRNKKETLDKSFQKLMAEKAFHFKLALPIYSFKELMQGHLWFLEDPVRRSFLPVSLGKKKSGRWRWYRQIFGPQMKWHFIKESLSGIADQPFLYEHLLSLRAYPFFFKNRKPLGQIPFSAVLGDPIIHSASPAFHREFFKQYGLAFVKIPMKEEDFTRENLCVLKSFGLVFSAVTSPLKKKAFKICDSADFSAREVRSVNTLILKDQKWIGSNTDLYGLQALLKEAGIRKPENSMSKIVVWGGGGVRKILEKELPFADFYSARTGQKRDLSFFKRNSDKHFTLEGGAESSLNGPPQQGLPLDIIWALGRSRQADCVFPPSFWKPRRVVDLNYTEDSPGLEYALKVGAEYTSGKTMFLNQAKKQQSLFLRHYKLNK